MTQIDTELLLCSTAEELDNILTTLTIGTVVGKIEYLKDYMGIIGTSTFGDIDADFEYEILQDSFLEGNWRSLSGKQF